MFCRAGVTVDRRADSACAPATGSKRAAQARHGAPPVCWRRYLVQRGKGMARHITLPLCHIKMTTGTMKTGKKYHVFTTYADEIFWQPLRGNLHLRQAYVAKWLQRRLQGHVGHSGNAPGSDGATWQGIMAKSGNYVTRHIFVHAHDSCDVAGFAHGASRPTRHGQSRRPICRRHRAAVSL
jgi:hypothetical protein